MSHSTVDCEFCGSNFTKPRFDFGEAKIYACSTCNISFTYPKPTVNDLSEVYNENYFSNKAFLNGDVETTYGYLDYEETKRLNDVEHFRISNEIKKHFKGNIKDKRLLDVGCGMGAFLKAASETGFEVEGVEFSDFAAESIKSNYGFNVYSKNGFDELLASGSTYDVIVLFDVIEHLLDPMKTIHEVHQLLSEDGLLLVGTTDFNHVIPKVLGDKFEDFRRVREHIFFFGKKDLISTLEMNGFTHVKTESQKISLKASDLSARLMSANVPLSQLFKLFLSLPVINQSNIPISFGMKFISYLDKKSLSKYEVEEVKSFEKPAVLSVVIPVYNEEKTIEHVIENVLAVKIPDVSIELIIVDDGSRDNSRIILQGLQKQFGFKLILKPRNQGKGSALQLGFNNAEGDIVVIQDADLEYNPRDYSKLIAPILAGDADAVYGSRFLSPERRVMKFWHTYGNKFLTFLCNLTVNLNITDMETCYKVMKTDVAKSLAIKSQRFDVEPEITCKLALSKMRIYEVPIQYHARTFEEGKKIGMKDLFQAIWAIFKFGVVRIK